MKSQSKRVRKAYMNSLDNPAQMSCFSFIIVATGMAA